MPLHPFSRTQDLRGPNFLEIFLVVSAIGDAIFSQKVKGQCRDHAKLEHKKFLTHQ